MTPNDQNSYLSDLKMISLKDPMTELLHQSSQDTFISSMNVWITAIQEKIFTN